ncbi:MAG: hypothetical protein WEC84_01440 [Candidatus Andersenbacteria bacterium]
MKKSSAKTAKKLAITPTARQALARWKKIRGIFANGPSDPVAWQRKMRKDRKIL